MALFCKVCGTQMQLRHGKFGPFYFCIKSRVKDLHGTINKAQYDAARAASTTTIIASDTADAEMLVHLNRIEAASAANALDFYPDYQLSEDDEWQNILPKG